MSVDIDVVCDGSGWLCGSIVYRSSYVHCVASDLSLYSVILPPFSVGHRRLANDAVPEAQRPAPGRDKLTWFEKWMRM